MRHGLGVQVGLHDRLVGSLADHLPTDRDDEHEQHLHQAGPEQQERIRVDQHLARRTRCACGDMALSNIKRATVKS